MHRIGLDGLGRSRLLTLARKSAQSFSVDRCTLAAAAISYHALLSIFPLAIVLTWVATWFISDTDAVEEVVELITDQIGLTPDATAELESQLSSAISATQPAGLVGLLVLIWTASALMTAIRRSVNLAWSGEARRFYLVGKLIDIGIVVLLGTLIGASVLISLLRDLLPELFDDLVVPTLFVAPIAVSFLALLMSYRFLPAVRTYVRDIWPAALAGALAFELLKFGFGLYLDRFSSNDVIYGSLAAVIGFMLFVYFAAIILLAGAELASELPRVRAGVYDDEAASPQAGLTARLRGLFRRATRGKPEEDFRMATKRGDEPPGET